MGKWMVIVEHPLDELKYFGGFLSKLKVDLHKTEQDLAVHERPYVVYLSAADIILPRGGHLSIGDMMKSTLDTSKYLKFNYNILYKGRGVYFRTEYLGDEALIRLKKEIKFIKPEFIFVASNLEFLIKPIIRMFPTINILSDSSITGNYYNVLKRDVFAFNDVDQLYAAFVLYKDLVLPFPSKNSWEHKYYNLALSGAEIDRDFAEVYTNHRLVNPTDLYDISKLEVVSTKKDILDLEEIL